MRLLAALRSICCETLGIIMGTSSITCSGLAATGDVKGIKLSWAYADPFGGSLPNIALSAVEVYEASVNNRADGSFAKVGEGQTDFLRAGLNRGDVRYYWVRARNKLGNFGAYHPSGATAGVTGTEVSGVSSLVAGGGYLVHPSGFIEQWGRSTVGGSGAGTFNFPLAFPNAIYSFTCSTEGVLSTDPPFFCNGRAISVTQFTLNTWVVTLGPPLTAALGQVTVDWRALGS